MPPDYSMIVDVELVLLVMSVFAASVAVQAVGSSAKPSTCHLDLPSAQPHSLHPPLHARSPAPLRPSLLFLSLDHHEVLFSALGLCRCHVHLLLRLLIDELVPRSTTSQSPPPPSFWHAQPRPSALLPGSRQSSWPVVSDYSDPGVPVLAAGSQEARKPVRQSQAKPA